MPPMERNDTGASAGRIPHIIGEVVGGSSLVRESTGTVKTGLSVPQPVPQEGLTHLVSREGQAASLVSPVIFTAQDTQAQPVPQEGLTHLVSREGQAASLVSPVIFTAQDTQGRDRSLLEPRSEWTLTAAPQVSLFELFDGSVPDRDIVSTFMSNRYLDIPDKLQLRLFSAQGDEGGRETVMVGSEFTGFEINTILYAAAPLKSYGWRPEVILDDWDAIDGKDPEAVRVRNAHATMPGWSVVEKNIGHMRKLIRKLTQSTLDYERDFLYPVIRWSTEVDGNRKIILDPLPTELRKALQEQIGGEPDRLDRFNPLAGLVLLAAYSPGKTNWPKSDGFLHSDSDVIRDITATQVAGFAVRQVARAQMGHPSITPDNDLQQSPLLELMDSYLVANTTLQMV